ncbi:MAG: ATP-binding protein [Xanthobacteraceae bacterium]|nr:ATP-binding protein [Xanthobacteraceae bacterium]
MATEKSSPSPERRRGLTGRVARARWPLVASALVLFGFVAASLVPAAYALAAFVAIVAAALVGPLERTGDAFAPPGAAPAGAGADGRLLEAVIASFPIPVVLLERNGRVVAFNEAARLMAPALARGDAVSLALRVPEVVEALRQAVASGAPQRAEFSERVPVDRWVALHAVPVAPPAAAAETGLMLLVFQDLTPLRRVEEMRVDFVANASHELRTPLASLSGFIDTLQGPARDDAAARDRFLGIMKSQATRMARLIDDLLSLSRVELNEHLHPETPVDLVPVVRQVADSLQMLAREREVEIRIAVPPAPLLVPGDRDELTRVFENLVENALKYGASGKIVEIGFAVEQTPDGREAVVSVCDHGPGIAAEHLPRLTERFYRVDVGHSRAEGGTGLGLALVKHILNRHRGRLAIESVLGQGATFAVRLPLCTGTAAEAARITSQNQ